MTKKLFNVHLRTSIESLAGVLAAIKEVAELLEISPVKPSPVTEFRRARVAPNSGGVTGMTLAEEFISKNPTFSASAIERVFVKSGFSRKSVSPIISILVKAGHIKRSGKGHYEVIESK